RNVLLFQREGQSLVRDQQDSSSVLNRIVSSLALSQRDRLAYVLFSEAEVEKQLAQFGLSLDLPLSMLAVEFLPPGVGGDLPNPLGPSVRTNANTAATTGRFGEQNPDPLSLNNRPRRILRVSPLAAVAPIC